MLIGGAGATGANARNVATPTPHPSPQGGGDRLALHLKKLKLLALVHFTACQGRSTLPDCRLPTADCRLPTADCRLPPTSLRRHKLQMPPLEMRRHFDHEALHLVLRLLVVLEAHVEVEDHFIDARRFHLLQRVDDARR